MPEGLPRYTTAPADPARRRFIAASLLSVLGLLPAARAAGLAEQAPDAQNGEDWLLRMAGEPQATRALGRAYLAAHPDEQNGARLRTALLDALAATLGDRQPATLTPGEALAALRRLVRRDYLEAQVVLVDGWLLSRSEARLYALMAINADAG